MRSISKSALLIILFFSANTAFAAKTSTQVIERVQMTSTGTAYFRPVGLGGWGADECPDALYAYIRNTEPEFDNFVSLAIASKLNGSGARFVGTCNEAGTYFLVTYMYLM